ncbi:MAG: acyl-CoA dehydrogenase [Gammaproteobacteria bacterium]|nr:acyl-CoA dehydrogenase [Gammaproteobacteria bacterium]
MMSFFVIAILLAALVALFVFPPLRRPLISNRLLPWFRAALPTMSQTERDALEAGTVWWEGELFSGRPDWNKLLAIPAPKLSAEERAFLDGPVEELCRMLDDWRITEELHDLPPHVWQFIRDQRFFGMIIPKKYGGLEFSALAHSEVVMKISSRSVTAGVTVMVPNSLGPAELLLSYGTEEQKNYYLPRLARGEEVPCFALTGPEAGSDASSIPDKGVVCRGQFEGEEIVGIRLNWDKRYITLGPVATVLGLAFKLYDPDGLLGDKKELGITAALIPTTTPGVTIGNRHFPLSIPFQNGPNSGKDVFIPLDWLIGGVAGAGQGWRMLMECLAAGRSISLPAQSVGAGKLACRATGAYARIRKQFKMPIGRFEGVEEVLARIAGYTYMMDAARVMTAGAVDLGERPSVASAIVKYNLTERMRKVINDAMDVQGGSGICLGPRNLLGRVYQSIPIGITVEGANILTRSLIIFGQGAVRCHPYVLKEMRAAAERDAQRASVLFDQAFFGHIGFTVGNAVRALLHGVSGARLARAPSQAGAEQGYYRQLTRMSAAFALAADASMLVLGGSLKRKEKLSGRLADVLSQLYLCSAALKRFADQGRPEADLPLLRWSCDDALHQAQEALDGLLRNFPNRFAAAVLRVLVFPFGKSYAAPGDMLGHKAASVLLEPSSSRDRLTAGVYAPADLAEPLGRLDDALKKVIAAEAVEKKLRAALNAGTSNGGDEALLREGVMRGVIGEDEARIVQDAIEARKGVIKVDDFAPDYWRKEKVEWQQEHKAAARRSI